MVLASAQTRERVFEVARELGYHPEYSTFTQRPRSLAAATFAPVISAIQPSQVTEGSQNVRVVQSANPVLDYRVVEAVKQSHFQPATLNKHAIPVDMALTVNVQR